MSQQTENKSPFSKLIWIALIGLIPLAFLFFSKNEDRTAIIYQTNCANCHMDNGEGLKNLIPPLAGADYLSTHAHELACIIKHGMRGEMVVNGISYNQAMPANESLSEIEIANLVNYIRSEWGNNLPRIPLNQIQQDLKACEHEK